MRKRVNSRMTREKRSKDRRFEKREDAVQRGERYQDPSRDVGLAASQAVAAGAGDLTVRTGQVAWRRIASATLPSRIRTTPVRP